MRTLLFFLLFFAIGFSLHAQDVQDRAERHAQAISAQTPRAQYEKHLDYLQSALDKADQAYAIAFQSRVLQDIRTAMETAEGDRLGQFKSVLEAMDGFSIFDANAEDRKMKMLLLRQLTPIF